MKKNTLHTNDGTLSTLSKFNDRDSEAFGEIYSLLYKELYYFINSLYKNTVIQPEDIIQDLFFQIWDDKKRKFTSISHLRAFMFVVIKNGYKQHYNHQKFVDKVHHAISADDDYMIFRAAEAEIFSALPPILDMLPEECAKSLKLSLEGWEVKDIAEKLGKQPSTIYNQRKEAISILRKKLSKDMLIVILSLLKI